MVQADYGTHHAPPAAAFQQKPPPPERELSQLSRTLGSELNDDDDANDETFSYEEEDSVNRTFTERVWHCLDPTAFLVSDATSFDDDGHPRFGSSSPWTSIPALLRHFLYNPEFPEFTSLQQFSWAVILGVAMGIYTAVWKKIIERCVDFVWQTVPRKLLKWGFFTDLNGKFPLPNYMWICPAIFGGVSTE